MEQTVPLVPIHKSYDISKRFSEHSNNGGKIMIDIFGGSSELFGNNLYHSEIFEIIQVILENLRKSSDDLRKLLGRF